SWSVGQPASYNSNPVDALVEALWFSGVTVITSAGNDAGAVVRAPGNDPFVITVGSLSAGGQLSPFSDHGLTQDGFSKPEVDTIGEHVQAVLPAGTTLAGQQTTPGLPPGYGQLSGTSMSSAVAAGAAALVLAAHPGWSPGQVKDSFEVGARGSLNAIDVAAADSVDNPVNADANISPSKTLQLIYAQQLLGLHVTAATVVWSDVTWSDVTWSDVTWSDVVWSDVTWSDVVWSDVTWSDVTWSDVTWSDVTWSDVTWSDVTWSDVVWSDIFRSR
ncbi:MAG: S8 family serine peptidase, partial [Mycobacteriales bacterium]